MPSMRRPEPSKAPKPDMSAAYRGHTEAAPAIRKTTIELPAELHKRLMREKIDRDMSLKDLIIDALEQTYPEP